MKIYSHMLYVFTFALCNCREVETRKVDDAKPSSSVNDSVWEADHDSLLTNNPFIRLEGSVNMSRYFESMDSICSYIKSSEGIELNEYHLIHVNKQILDSLRAQDYYLALSRGIRIQNQRERLVLKRGDLLKIPSQAEVDSINRMLAIVTIDVNIPEYRLRIWIGDSLMHQCEVRVGRNERKYLALAGHEVNLQTPIGEGRIVRIERNPIYINPVDGHRYSTTRRDDGYYTRLPRIPFLEPEINGIRSGALIHPTTNRSTLGKAISNGCVGLSESDAWLVYYYAPLATRVHFRYDLELVDSTGMQIILPDIYQKNTPSN